MLFTLKIEYAFPKIIHPLYTNRKQINIKHLRSRQLNNQNKYSINKC